MKNKQIDMCQIGKSIKALRLSNNLTQEELADRVGYSVRNLRRIENNGTGSIDVVNYFTDIFQVSALDILNGCFLLLKIILKMITTNIRIFAKSHASSINLQYSFMNNLWSINLINDNNFYSFTFFFIPKAFISTKPFICIR